MYRTVSRGRPKSPACTALGRARRTARPVLVERRPVALELLHEGAGAARDRTARTLAYEASYEWINDLGVVVFEKLSGRTRPAPHPKAPATPARPTPRTAGPP